MPAEVEILAQLDPPAFSGEPWASTLTRLVASEALAVEAIAALDECQLHPSSWKRVAVGADHDHHLAVAIAGPGVGRAARWQCAATALERRAIEAASQGDDEPRARTTITALRSDRLIAETNEAKAFAQLVGDDLVVWSDVGWRDAVAERVAERSPPVRPTALATAQQRISPTAAAWAIGQVPDAARELVGAPAADGARTFRLELDARDGLELELVLDFDSAERAQTAARELELAVAASRWLAPLVAREPRGLDAVSVRADGTEFRLDVRLSTPDLAALTPKPATMR